MRLEKGEVVYEERPLPIEIESISWAGGNGKFFIEQTDEFIHSLNNVIQSVKPDLIHAGPIQRSAYLVALTNFKPLVSMSWGYDLIIDARINQEWERITRYTLERSSIMIGDCDTIRKLAISYGMQEERIITFPWGVDLKLFSQVREIPPHDQKKFTLLSTRGWEPIYGIDVIARAFVKAAKVIPYLHLILLGEGSQENLINQIFKDGGVTDKVMLPGQISQSELPNLYSSSDLYISASHSDGTSISLLEAIACGIPVIVSDIPGNQEWIEPGFHGWLFPDGDHEALAEAIIDAFRKRDRLPIMGNNARKLAEERADWGLNFQKLLNAYQMALNS